MKTKIIFIFILTAVFIITGYFIIQNGSISSYPHFFQGMATGIFSVTIIIWIIAIMTKIFRKSGDSDNKNQILLSAGMISLFIGTLLAMYNKENAIVLFITTVIIIISMIFNIIYIRKIRANLLKR